MEGLVNWYQSTLGQFVPKEVFVFFVSMLPFIELRGGLLCASMLKISLLKANIICVLGNIVPIPFILLFIKKIFAFMKEHGILKGLVEKLEQMAMRKDDSKSKGQFLFLLLFVGIPVPGTGAWSGSLIAALMEFDMKKTIKAIVCGLLLAVIIMDILSYGLLGNLVS